MTNPDAAPGDRARGGGGDGGPSLLLATDENLGLPVGEEPWSGILSAAGIRATSTTNLVQLDEMVANHEPDIAYIPAADYHRLFAKGDRQYRGLAIATSKFTGEPTLRSLLVVRKDDPATSLDDLQGDKYAYINKSCSSSYFPPAILLNRQGKKLDDFLRIMPTKPWQGQVDAVVSKEARATMVLEDVWKTSAENEKTTKIIGEFTGGKPPIVLVRDGLDGEVCKMLLDALLAWSPAWDGVYGGFKPYYYADVHSFFHFLDELPAGV